MAQVIINLKDESEAADACRLVADEIEKGYKSGIVGWSSDTWELNKD